MNSLPSQHLLSSKGFEIHVKQYTRNISSHATFGVVGIAGHPSCARSRFRYLVLGYTQLFIFERRACRICAEAFEEGLGLQNMGRRISDGESSRYNARDFSLQRAERFGCSHSREECRKESVTHV